MNVRRLVSLFAALGLGTLGSTGCGVSRISEVVGDDGVADDGVTDDGVTDDGVTDDGVTDDGNDDDPLPPILDVSNPPETTCEAWANHYVDCYGQWGGYYYYYSYDQLVDNCESWIDEYGNWYGPACAAAFEDYFACLADLPCNWDGPGEWPCSDASLALDNACWNQPIPG